MLLTVFACARRKLRRLARCVATIEPIFSAAEASEVLCVYHNDGPEANSIVFTTTGLTATFDEIRRHIRYEEIARAPMETPKDADSDELQLELADGSIVRTFVNGKDVERGTHDKYIIRMFLECAIHAVASS